MGLFSRKIKNPVHGTAQIVACSRHGGEGAWQNCRMQLIVHVEGQPPYSTEVHQLAPRKKWPQPGMTVPVHIARDDRDRLKVDFDSMETNRDMARRLAEQQAAAHRHHDGGAPIGGMPAGALSGLLAGVDPSSINIVGDPNDLSPERLAQVEQMLGMDLDGDGAVAGASSGAASTGRTDDDRIAQLERLAALRTSGALSDEEFEREKQRLLGS